jgi:hypothetical protein
MQWRPVVDRVLVVIVLTALLWVVVGSAGRIRPLASTALQSMALLSGSRGCFRYRRP